MKTIRERIETIEREIFYLEMKDHWKPADWAKNNELNRELDRLKKEEKN